MQDPTSPRIEDRAGIDAPASKTIRTSNTQKYLVGALANLADPRFAGWYAHAVTPDNGQDGPGYLTCAPYPPTTGAQMMSPTSLANAAATSPVKFGEVDSQIGGTADPQAYSQTEKASCMDPNHFLNDMASFGYYKCEPSKAKASSSTIAAVKQKVFVCVNVSDIVGVSAADESFTVRVRLYVNFQVDLRASGLHEFCTKAVENGEYYSLDEEEVQLCSKKLDMPVLSFGNALEKTALDDAPSIRVYGGHQPMQMLMWNQGVKRLTCTAVSLTVCHAGYLLKLRETFELHNFPFDQQELTIQLTQDNPRFVGLSRVFRSPWSSL
jgi:hypothetical protein